ncbi:MAG: succinylglutamate desuccinylase/aspartoacylase family protein [Candidatus Atribacteria bacterium]|nr:succinylglutamate desuccinylase/aspartoacylase family protein [Candidatus Atribacteria bacterium]
MKMLILKELFKNKRHFLIGRKLKIFLGIGIGILYLPFIFSGNLYASEMTSIQEVICEETEYQTNVYYFSAEDEGPTVMILSGVHGNELAGIEASRIFMENFHPDKGTVIFIPEANKRACEKRVRSLSPEEDLNRLFPGDLSSDGIQKLAGEIFRVMTENKVTFLLDLHESVNYYHEDPNRYGQTIILDDNAYSLLQEIGNYLIHRLNSNISDQNKSFEVIIKPIHGSSTYEALKLHDIPSITFETCMKMELSERVDLHYQCIESLLKYYKIISSSLIAK